MTSEEWTNYYDKNLATTAVGDMVLSELQEMKEQLAQGELVDAELE